MTRVIVRLLLALAWIGCATAAHAQDAARGVQLFEAGDWTGARAAFTAAIQHNDRDASAHYWLGRLALIDDDPGAAADRFEQAVKLDGNTADYHLWFGRALGQQAMRSSKLRQPFLARRVKAEFERAVALDDHNVDARDGLVDFYSMAPGVMGGSAEKAREQAQAIARLDAMRGHLASSRLAMRAKDGGAVEREMTAAIAAAPDSLRPYSALANWHVSETRWPQAFAALDRYLERRPEDPLGLYGVGRISALSGQQLERGERGLRAYLAAPPKDATPLALARAHLRLGQVLEHAHRNAEARASIERALKLDPRNDDAKKALSRMAKNPVSPRRGS